MSEDFLSRWSRRKRETRRAEAAEPAAAPAPPRPDDAPRPIEQASLPAADAVELTEEEIARLPKPEDLTIESDLAAFLRKGVPEALRNAALRRMWSLDPAIRDYVGDARDYAYDWNVPGGVPGTGPLSPAEMANALAQPFGGEAAPGESVPPAPSDSFDRGNAASQDRALGAAGGLRADDSDVALQQGAPGRDQQQGVSQGDAMVDATSRDSLTAGAAQQNDSHAPTAAPARRHGAAKPF